MRFKDFHYIKIHFPLIWKPHLSKVSMKESQATVPPPPTSAFHTAFLSFHLLILLTILSKDVLYYSATSQTVSCLLLTTSAPIEGVIFLFSLFHLSTLPLPLSWAQPQLDGDREGLIPHQPQKYDLGLSQWGSSWHHFFQESVTSNTWDSGLRISKGKQGEQGRHHKTCLWLVLTLSLKRLILLFEWFDAITFPGSPSFRWSGLLQVRLET